MIISQTAKIYAKGLIQTKKSEAVSYDVVLAELENVYSVINNSNELKSVLHSPAIAAEQKILIIEDIFANRISEVVVNLLKLVAEKNRFNEFEQIIEAFKLEIDNINGVQRIQVISAIELIEEHKNKIIEKLHAKLNKTIVADWQIDTNIIAGLIIKIDDNVIDTSIKNKLENLSKIKGNL